MKTVLKKFIHSNAICLMLAVGGISTLAAQEISKFDLEERAAKNFENHRFDQAVADYEVLHEMYPKEAEYAYHLGRSYLSANENPDKAAELLKFAATRNVGSDTYFYLGLAYHRGCRFEDAALSLVTFQKMASSHEQKKYDVDYWLAITANARQSVQLARSVAVLQQQPVKSAALECAFKNAANGKFIYVPNEFRTEIDREMNYQPLMFLPNQVSVNDYVFFSSYGKNKKQGIQIYRAQRVNETDYSLPQPLPESINTPYDDAYPVFDLQTSTLYFSSKGLNSMGGYDIFSCRYNAATQEWATPVKLDFPINSVYDDILYTPELAQTCGFLSNRNASTGGYVYYQIADKPGDYRTPATIDEILACSRLDQTLSVPDIAVPSPVLASLPATSQDGDTGRSTNGAKVKEAPSAESDYSKALQKAMELQLQSDSLASIVKTLRLKARDMHNYQKKQELVAEITSKERETKQIQQLADSQFTLAESLRIDTPSNPVWENSGTVPQTETDYTANLPHSIDKTAKSKTYETGFTAAQNAGQVVMADFQISDQSPYSNNNPIPVTNTPMGLVYKIQLGAYAGVIPEDNFGGLSPVSKEPTGSNTRYYVGIFTTSKEARKALSEVKSYGYPDAFLVPYFKTNKISMQQAREIEFSED